MREPDVFIDRCPEGWRVEVRWYDSPFVSDLWSAQSTTFRTKFGARRWAAARIRERAERDA